MWTSIRTYEPFKKETEEQRQEKIKKSLTDKYYRVCNNCFYYKGRDKMVLHTESTKYIDFSKDVTLKYCLKTSRLQHWSDTCPDYFPDGYYKNEEEMKKLAKEVK